MIAPLVCDLTGRTQTWLWLLHTFGRVQYHPATPQRGRPLYRITRLSAGVTGQLLTATVLDEEGRRLPRIRVVRAWTHSPDSPRELPAGNTLGDYVATTDAEGLAEFPAGAADLYALPACGRSSLWIADLDRRPSKIPSCRRSPPGGRRSPPGGRRSSSGGRRSSSGEGPPRDGVPSDAISGIGILQSDLGLRLCLHITWKRMRAPDRTFPPGPAP
jgi:hypothetical protein